MKEVLKQLNRLDNTKASPLKRDSSKLIFASGSDRDFLAGTPSNELFNALADSSPIGMYIVQEGEFKFISRKFAEILEYSQSELVGSKSINYVHPEDRDMVEPPPEKL